VIALPRCATCVGVHAFQAGTILPYREGIIRTPVAIDGHGAGACIYELCQACLWASITYPLVQPRPRTDHQERLLFMVSRICCGVATLIVNLAQAGRGALSYTCCQSEQHSKLWRYVRRRSPRPPVLRAGIWLALRAVGAADFYLIHTGGRAKSRRQSLMHKRREPSKVRV